MGIRGPIQTATHYAADVDELTDAWAFVMTHLDAVGPHPTISIEPFFTPSDDPDDHPHHFRVAVSGAREEPA